MSILFDPFVKNKPKKLVEKLLLKCGFVPQAELDRCEKVNRTNTTRYHKELARIDKQNIERLAREIREVRMVKATYDNGHITWSADSQGETAEPSYRTIAPPEENWYQLTTRIDVGAMQRIYENTQLGYNTGEYEYFVQSILHEIRHNFEVLMRINH